MIAIPFLPGLSPGKLPAAVDISLRNFRKIDALLYTYEVWVQANCRESRITMRKAATES
jgi:hypothetical protein